MVKIAKQTASYNNETRRKSIQQEITTQPHE
jgi:hypothetical protein